jgi:sugar phosphate isomerase/epimerase
MRISVSSVAFPGATLAELPKLAADVGAEGLAITCSDRGSLQLDTSGSDLRDFRSRCEDMGIAISAVYGYAGRGMLGTPLTKAEDTDVAKRCIDIAVHLNCGVSRLFAWKGAPSIDLINRFVDACRPSTEYAAVAGVMIGIPTHHDLAFDPASCLRLIDGLGRDRAEIIFNGQSLELDGIQPVAALRAMLDIVGQIELKDWRREDGEAIPVPIGTGQATVFPVVEELAALGFSGWLTLHHLKQHHPELPSLEPRVSLAVRKTIAAYEERTSHVER